MDSITEGADYVNNKLEAIENRLKWIMDEMKGKDDSCFELSLTSEEMNLQPFTTESQAKAFQHNYQLLNSNLYTKYIANKVNSENSETVIEQENL